MLASRCHRKNMRLFYVRPKLHMIAHEGCLEQNHFNWLFHVHCWKNFGSHVHHHEDSLIPGWSYKYLLAMVCTSWTRLVFGWVCFAILIGLSSNSCHWHFAQLRLCVLEWWGFCGKGSPSFTKQWYPCFELHTSVRAENAGSLHEPAQSTQLTTWDPSRLKKSRCWWASWAQTCGERWVEVEWRWAG